MAVFVSFLAGVAAMTRFSLREGRRGLAPLVSSRSLSATPLAETVVAGTVIASARPPMLDPFAPPTSRCRAAIGFCCGAKE